MKKRLFTIITLSFLTLTSSCTFNEVDLSNPFNSEKPSSLEEESSIIDESTVEISTDESSENHEVENVIYEDFQVHFLELGVYNTGDCTYIKAGETDVLIDAGAAAASAPVIIDYVNQYCTDGILEYVITTHAHDDHYTGMFGNSKQTTNFFNESISRTGIMYYYDIGTIIDFSQTTKDPSKGNYLKYIEARDYAISQGATHYYASDCFNETNGAKKSFILDETKNITMDILYNKYYFEQSSDENDHSVCTMFNYNNHHFMMTGDLEEKGEEAMAAYYDKSSLEKTLPHVDLFKAGHHGSKTSSNKVLLDLITPEICCAGSSEYTIDNNNTFPTQDFIDRIALYTDKVYVTSVLDTKESRKQEKQIYKSLNGNIIVSCNGANTSVSCSNNNTILKDSEWFNEKIYVVVSEKGIKQICSGTKKTDYYTATDENVVLIKTRRKWPE